jgi:hypothetical protein
MLSGKGLDIMVGYVFDCPWIVERIKNDIDKLGNDKGIEDKRKNIEVWA